MTDVQPNSASSNVAPKIAAKDIHAKWDKISEQEASGMKQTSDLVSQVQSKYSLNVDEAKKQVDTWVGGRSFQ